MKTIQKRQNKIFAFDGETEITDSFEVFLFSEKKGMNLGPPQRTAGHIFNIIHKQHPVFKFQ